MDLKLNTAQMNAPHSINELFVITPIFCMSTYNTLVDRIYQISYNVASMQTTLSGGKIIFLALTMSATPFVKPPNPIRPQ